MQSIFIPGEPALWSAGADQRSMAREEQCKQRIREALQNVSSQAPQTILLHFAVREWTRRGHYFDLDNLVTPVFRAIYGDSNRARTDARTAVVSWRAVIGQAAKPFLLLTFLETPRVDLHYHSGFRFIIDKLWTGPLPSNSRDGDCGMPLWVRQEINGYLPSNGERFGVQLTFGGSVLDITRPEEKPIKPVIDCLYPIFGGAPGRGEDWKKLILQVERRSSLPGSCHVRCWPLSMDADLSSASTG